MRWTIERRATGSERVRKKFLLWPIFAYDEVRWLEFAFVSERWYNEHWCFVCFLTEEEYDEKKKEEGKDITF